MRRTEWLIGVVVCAIMGISVTSHITGGTSFINLAGIQPTDSVRSMSMMTSAPLGKDPILAQQETLKKFRDRQQRVKTPVGDNEVIIFSAPSLKASLTRAYAAAATPNVFVCNSVRNATQHDKVRTVMSEKFDARRVNKQCNDPETGDLTATPRVVSRAMVDLYMKLLSVRSLRELQETKKGHLSVRKGFTPLHAIDIGCGCGLKLHDLVSRYPVTGVGIDISPFAIEYAWKHYTDSHEEFCEGNVFEAKNLHRTADIVIEHGAAIRYHSDECWAMHYALRLLKPENRTRGALLRGHVEMESEELVRCLFGWGSYPEGYVPFKKDKLKSTAWWYSPWNRSAVGVLRYDKFHPSNNYRRFYTYFMFYVQGITRDEAARLPPTRSFYNYVDRTIAFG